MYNLDVYIDRYSVAKSRVPEYTLVVVQQVAACVDTLFLSSSGFGQSLDFCLNGRVSI